MVASHGALDTPIDYYLGAASPPELFRRILGRWESGYDAGRQLVSRSMALLWAARRGLAESEIRDLLGTSETPLLHAAWSPLYLAAESALINRSGLLTFSHDYLREAVRERYLSSAEEQTCEHRRLADYFERRDLSPRQIDELPWQVLHAGDLERLAELFAYRKNLGHWSRQFLSVAWDHNRFETQTYWRPSRTNEEQGNRGDRCWEAGSLR